MCGFELKGDNGNGNPNVSVLLMPIKQYLIYLTS